jgi:hydroxyethylthiazole kinase-like uncharacterized protein yjeF
MRRLERIAVRRYGIPVFLLMEHAGRAVAGAVRTLMRGKRGRVIVLCGGGNNGGDGVAAARTLRAWGYRTDVFWIHNPAEWKGSSALHYAMARRQGVAFHSFSKIPAARRLRVLQRANVLVDALLGTGIKSPLRVPMFDAIATLNAARKPVVAVDLPSGLDAETGRPQETAVKARVTVTMAAPKKGLLKPAARPFVGKLVVADIGLPTSSGGR